MAQKEIVSNVFRNIFSNPKTIVRVVILALVFAVLSMGFYKVEPGEQGVPHLDGGLGFAVRPVEDHALAPQLIQVGRLHETQLLVGTDDVGPEGVGADADHVHGSFS